jgi:16S rRNA processing protein RimM
MVEEPATGQPSEGRVAVGRINSPWGLRGHMKVTPFTSNPERLQEGATVLVLGEPVRILDVRTPQGFPIIQFEGYTDRTAAELLRDTLIEIPESELRPLPDGEYYVHDLEGLDVVSTEGEAIGRLEEVIQTGSNDVYLVRRPGRRDALIPALEDVVREVNLEARRMVIEVVPGLLDD